MFTGIVHECGRLISPPEASGSGLSLRLGMSQTLIERLEIGASLAVSGVCLTIVRFEAGTGREGACLVEVSPETLRRTTLGELQVGGEVNLEPALRAGDAMGGHWVQGHVDGVVKMIERRDTEGWRELAFEIPADYRGQIVEKGSVTLDGVSLTVSSLADDRFEVALVPHTLEVTTFDGLAVGDSVNFEADILAKYVERALSVAGQLTREGAS